ncbi:hypothetical protein F2P44_23710 [Massilia sp. CCM 8695]|uniref:Uncharacterized protein n=1 Tax=Massilia frigida TaxID=2609281 RepID=A0ABX0NA07_9BURK|nr:hypothetical protein [Massilia frigida]NHZ82261.1 hypothetical protein [Massilia frigida]
MAADHVHAMRHADGYGALVRGIKQRFNSLAGPVFRTDASGLYETYLASFTDLGVRQQHSCNCCRTFIERFGGLATVGDDGVLVSAIWDADAAPAPYRAVVAALARRVSQAGIAMLFLSSETRYGKPANGPWQHLAIEPATVFKSAGLHNAWQTACARREAFASVQRAMRQYSAPVCAAALRLLKAETLFNAEAALGQARFLVDLHTARDAVGGQHQDNLTYRMVATAPMGFCHPRSSMIATLLDDIIAGKSSAELAASWAAKMDVLQYLRPQAAPPAGAIKAAEAALEKVGAASALQRRFATMADIQETVWLPPAPADAGRAAGVQPHAESVPAAPIVMTLDTFRRTVLPAAERIEMAALTGRQPFIVFTSAVHADARPILQWDTPERRNPVAWYTYSNGSLPAQFNLSGSYYAVTAVILPPWAWAGRIHPQFGEHIVFLLRDARDLRECEGHSALFPVHLKSELREFRSTIEAYSKANALEGVGDDNVAGLALTRSHPSDVSLRVTSNGQASEYRLLRWD